MTINNEIPCVAEVEGYGICGRPAQHIVHAKLGISPVEHMFKRETTGKTESMRLSKRNIKKIARRSGKTEDELEMMRQVAKKQGRVLTLQYEVVAQPHQVLGGLKLDRVIVDEVDQ